MKNNLSFLICKAIFLLICALPFTSKSANPFSKLENIVSPTQAATDLVLKQKLSDWMHKSKVLGFQENKGQIIGDDGKPADFVLYKAEAPNLNIWVTNTGLTYQFFRLEEDEEEEEREHKKEHKEKSEGEKDAKTNWYRVDMVLKGAVIKKENVVTEGDITQGEVNFYLGHCPNGIFNAKTFTKVIIKEIYKGIDWVIYTSNEGGIKHDFIVHPHADPNQIKLIYEGNGKFNVKNNQISFENKLGKVIEGSLLCYQSNQSNIIQSTYKVKENESSKYLGAGNLSVESSNFKSGKKGVFSYEVSFELNEYNKNEILIIDPQLTWSTYFGSNAADGAYDIKVDPAGNIYVAAYTSSSAFPLQNWGGAYNQTIPTGWECLILRFNNVGTLTWATYYGGNGSEEIHSIAFDTGGNVYLTGFTFSTNFPTQFLAGAYNQSVFGGGMYDIFVLRFSNTGVRTWATYYGGTATESANSIASDPAGNIYLTGHVSGLGFPLVTLGGAYNQSYSGGQEIFILRFNNLGACTWATYYGGTGDMNGEVGNSITSDASGNIYLTGHTSSPNFPIQNWAGAYNQPALASNAGSGDVFVLRFTNAGVRTWATYYGGSGFPWSKGNSILCDASGNIFVTGITASTTFPTQIWPGAYNQTVFAGGQEAFILRFTNAGVRTWATFYGGSGTETRNFWNNLAIDNCGNFYVSFETRSSNIFTLGNTSCGFYDSTLDGFSDQFIIKFNNLGAVLWATYFGPSGADFREPIGVDNSGNLYFAGEWLSGPGAPLANPGGGAYYDATHNGTDDIFISKFIPVPPTYTQTQVNPTACTCNGVATISVTCGEAPYSYQWSNAVSVLNTTLTTHNISGLCPGVYQVTVTSNCNYTYTTTYTLTGAASTLTANITTINASCTNPTGSVTINSVTNGVPNYTIAEGTTTLAANVNVPYTISGVTVGTHTYLITSSNGCSTTFTAAILPGGSMPNISIAPPTTLTCLTNSLIVIGTSTTSGVTYSWSPQNVTTNTAVVISAGNYTLTVTNTLSGCSSSSVIAVTQNTTVPNISTTVPGTLTCLTTSVILTGTSTTSGATYSWSPQNVTTNTAVVTSAGSYTCFVSDPSNGCTNSNVISVTQNTTVPNISTTIPGTLTCLISSVTLQGNSTTTGATFTWQPINVNSATATTTGTGNYSLTVTDPANGCTSTTVVAVSQNTFVPNVSATTPATLTCATTSVILTGVSTTSGATFTWLPQNVNTNTAVATSAGNYTLTVTDPINGCTSNTIVAISQNTTAPNISATIPATLTCLTTSVVLTGSSTTGGVTYSWSPQNVSTNTAAATSAGNYSFSVTDPINGCASSTIVSVIQNGAFPNISVNIPAVLNCTNTFVVLTGTSTTSGVTYSWQPQNVNTTTASATSAGNYTFVVNDPINGCTSNSIVTVSQSTTVPGLTVFLSNNLNCINSTATLSANSAGNIIVWNGGSLINAVNPSVVSSPGNYTVTATDPLNGCTSTTVVAVSQNTVVPNVSATTPATLTCATTSVILTGVSTTSGATFTWLPQNVNTNTAVATSAGNYTLTVLDPLNGCINSTTLSVNTVPMFTANISVLNQINCFGNNNGALQISNAGGNPPFSITNLNNSNNINNIFSFPVNLNGLSAANYSIQITDAIGCTQILFASISQPPALSIGLNGNTTICEGQSTAITSTVSGGTAPYTFLWSPIGGSTPVLYTFPSINTAFTVTVIDNNGCQTSANVAIIVNPKPNASLTNNKVFGCAPVCASFSLSESQATGYSYNWAFTNNTTGSITASSLYNPELCFNTPGTYNASLVIATPAGCTTGVNYNALITVYDKPIADFSASPDKPSILEPTVNFTNLTTGATNYIWYNINTVFSIQTNPTYTFQDPGLFLITLLAYNGQCSDTISKVITIDDEFLFYIPNTFTPNDDNLNDFFHPVISGCKEDDYNFMIFDRWGAQIFRTTEPRSKGWNGFYKGELCKEDVYVWKINVVTNKGIAKEYTGHVTLLK